MLTKKNRLERRLRLIIWAGVLLSLTLPLLATKSVPSVTYAKATFLQIFMVIILAAWLLLALSNRQYRLNWRHPAVIGTGLFLLALYATLPFSLDPAKSFWSIEMRMMGVFAMTHYLLLALALGATFKTWSAWRIIFLYSTIVCLLTDLIGFHEALTLGAGRIAATMGNTLYFAVYLLMHIFLALILFFKEKNIYWTYFLGLALGAHVLALILTASRGPVLALVMAAGLGVFYYVLTLKNRGAKIKILIPLLLLAALGAAGLFWSRAPENQDWAKNHLPRQIYRLTGANIPNERLMLWRYAWQGFKERPLTGFGLENSQVVIDKFYDPADIVFGERWHNRFHNQYFEILTLTGLVGAFGYAAFWLGLLYALIRQYRARPERRDRLALGALGLLLVAYLLQNATLFDLPVSMFLLSLSVGYLISLADSQPTKPAKIPEMNPGLLIPVLVFGLALLCAFYLSYRPLLRTMDEVNGHRLITGDRAQALVHFQKAMRGFNPYRDDLRIWMTSAARLVDQYMNTPMPDARELALWLGQEMEQAAQKRPHDSQIQIFYAFAARFAASFDSAWRAQAQSAANTAIAMVPRHPEGYEEMAELYFSLKEYGLAQDYYEQTLQIAFRASDEGRLQTRLATLAAAQGDYETALAWLNMPKTKYDPAAQPRLAWPLAVAAPESENPEALAHVIEVLQHHKTHPEVIQALILLYKKAGDEQTAADNLKALNQLYPAMAREFEELYWK